MATEKPPAVEWLVFEGPTVFEGPDFANGTRVKAHVRSGGVAAV